MQPRKSPLPIRDGVSPSYLWLPAGQWPDLIAFFRARFPHLGDDVLLGRFERGDLVDEEGRPLRAGDPYKPGRRIWYYREVPPETPVPFEEAVLHRDERLLVVDKPHFLAMIPAGRHLRETLLSRLRNRFGLPELTPLHRLDRETAGVTLFCLHPPSRGAYQSLFQARTVQKTYEAVAPYRAGLDLPLVHRSRLEEGADGFTMVETAGEPNSETRVELIERLGELARYRLSPHTGRKHQLRAHMAALGIPIVDDPWYPAWAGVDKHGDDFSRPLKLLARSIAFTDPFSGEPRRFDSLRTL
ncbi:pseudouridine synthase [Chitinimonas koreensis]|uniref:pseudouridine synthase n=1 Tax=Chitinimonas koreensis TaxID=356302 RepID=UPI00040C4438|nr:pseudouridine synthase [Chitinimonas koreensis]QNM97573.1 pseudouridine synthase [Chitinimonas koreensis]